ncbi:hypothetical protein GJAV_G00142710 [Gymnothorax javanicus]|nr:hypothetical protein GJAV_G00142710 [Gymnothorax javanicus]
MFWKEEHGGPTRTRRAGRRQVTLKVSVLKQDLNIFRSHLVPVAFSILLSYNDASRLPNGATLGRSSPPPPLSSPAVRTENGSTFSDKFSFGTSSSCPCDLKYHPETGEQTECLCPPLVGTDFLHPFVPAGFAPWRSNAVAGASWSCTSLRASRIVHSTAV